MENAILAVTAHFLDVGYYRRDILLGLRKLHGQHIGENIGDSILLYTPVRRFLAISMPSFSNVVSSLVSSEIGTLTLKVLLMVLRTSTANRESMPYSKRGRRRSMSSSAIPKLRASFLINSSEATSAAAFSDGASSNLAEYSARWNLWPAASLIAVAELASYCHRWLQAGSRRKWLTASPFDFTLAGGSMPRIGWLSMTLGTPLLGSK